MFMAAYSEEQNNWKQPRCPSIGEWLNRLWSTRILEHSSAIRENRFLTHTTTW